MHHGFTLLEGLPVMQEWASMQGWAVTLFLGNAAWLLWRFPSFTFRFGDNSPGRWPALGGAGLLGAVAAATEPTAIPVLMLGWAGTLVDARCRKLPADLTSMMLVQMIVLLAAQGQTNWGDAIIGGALWTGPLMVGWLLRQVGLGDCLLAPSLGLWLGSINLGATAVGFACALGGAALWSIAVRGRGAHRFALGPFLWGGAVLAWVGTVSHMSGVYATLLSC